MRSESNRTTMQQPESKDETTNSVLHNALTKMSGKDLEFSLEEDGDASPSSSGTGQAHAYACFSASV